MLDKLKFHASAAAPLFSGTDGLTDTQIKRIAELQFEKDNGVNANGNKVKWTDNKDAELKDLLKRKANFDDGIVELPKGAKTYVENVVNQIVYGYRPAFAQKGNRQVEKGQQVEDDAIELIGTYFMKEYKKSESSLSKGHFVGHPDIEDEEDEMILDNKSSWTKETFPTLPEQIDSSTYEWQGKLYCYMKGWRSFRLVYTLMTTPEGLIPENENDDLHYADDLNIGLRVTYVDYELTDEDIAHIERRHNAAVEYALKYYSKLMEKCLN